jgi:hypothetical protein
MGVRIEADGELSPDETAAIRAAVERYTETADAPVHGATSGWADAARGESIRGRPPRPGGREAWQAARDRRRETREQAG